jgi:anti-sigma B factor antagonist
MDDLSFGVDLDLDDRLPVIAISGVIDAISASFIEMEIELAMDDFDHLGVVDLTAVTFVAPAALTLLVRTRKRCAEHGEKLRVVCTNPLAVQLFEHAGPGEIFEIFDSRASAFADRDDRAVG